MSVKGDEIGVVGGGMRGRRRREAACSAVREAGCRGAVGVHERAFRHSGYASTDTTSLSGSVDSTVKETQRGSYQDI
ncbi:unnamed protein product [Parnassius apollo]|uniref:(apollo) hypothetical protein n=1 Tax=Parnassius apollo TaxID=110799 RepID=A0A8S3X2T4_PARAO|nr:unnamed protein product [Parnassius apollo]